MSRAPVLAVALALCGALGSCGIKGQPLPPELVQPLPPGRLVASATPEGVRLTWRRPQHYEGGARMRDLGRFVIERAVCDGPRPVYLPVHTIELDDQARFRPQRQFEWTDLNVTQGTLYRYRIVAITLDGYRSRPAGPVDLLYQKKEA